MFDVLCKMKIPNTFFYLLITLIILLKENILLTSES